jgi:hypothetical protein
MMKIVKKIRSFINKSLGLTLAKKYDMLIIMEIKYNGSTEHLVITSNEIDTSNGNSESSLIREIRANKGMIMPGGVTPFDKNFLEVRFNLPRIDLDYIIERNPDYIDTFHISAVVPINSFNTPNRKYYETPNYQGKLMTHGITTIGGLITAIANSLPIICCDTSMSAAVLDYLNDNGIKAEYSQELKRIILPDIKL